MTSTIPAIRSAVGWTQAALADRLNVSLDAVKSWESRGQRPRRSRYADLERAIRDELLDRAVSEAAAHRRAYLRRDGGRLVPHPLPLAKFRAAYREAIEPQARRLATVLLDPLGARLSAPDWAVLLNIDAALLDAIGADEEGTVGAAEVGAALQTALQGAEFAALPPEVRTAHGRIRIVQEVQHALLWFREVRARLPVVRSELKSPVNGTK